MNPQPNDKPFEEDTGPILVLAGPGTGKTYQLAKRLQRLTIEKNVDPKTITVITFTSEAAKSMRNKLAEEGKAEYLEPNLHPKNIVTMHSLGHRILEQNAKSIGLKPNIEVVGSVTLKKAILRDAAFRLNYSEDDSKVALDDKTKANKNRSKKSQEILAEYSRILKSCNAIDFDDQIELACEILAANPKANRIYREQTRHLLVDEYQDINETQHKFINILTKNQEDGLFAVGDDDQSIYGFRGGEPSYIRNFHKNYRGAKIYQLETSRRCLKNILDCAIEVVKKHDLSRSQKVNPVYLSEENGEVVVRNCPSDTKESELIAKMIYAKKIKKEAEDFYILVPNRNYASLISKALDANGVEHENATGQLKNLDWESLKILRKWFTDPNSNLVSRHVIELLIEAGKIGVPTSRVRAQTKKEERSLCSKELSELWGAESILDRLDAVNESSKIHALKNAVDELLETSSTNDSVRLVKCLKNYFGIWKDVEKLLSSLWAISELSETSSLPTAKVRILTIQASKGLEADCVFMIALEEGTLPRDIKDLETTAEEARLMFVGMTRAKKELHISHVRKRTGASSYRASPGTINSSPFISVFPSNQHSKVYIGAKK